jgi:hypothetical protein
MRPYSRAIDGARDAALLARVLAAAGAELRVDSENVAQVVRVVPVAGKSAPGSFFSSVAVGVNPVSLVGNAPAVHQKEAA